jgi:hypothetical protein
MKNLSPTIGVSAIRGGLRSTASPRWQAAMRATLAITLPFLLLAAALGQTPSDSPEGIENGNYHYEGSVEFGYRFVDTTGSNAVYDTLVNQQQGPRLLEQTLNMRSLNHAGALFDNLYLSSFGWGGDPENATRLRVSKNKWYNFNLTFRRDQNVWDYNLQANPLNPPNTFIQLNDSPHEFLTTRRMYDYNLTLLPQSAVRFRLGYTRNNMEGPSFSSIHEGTDTLLFQNWSTVLDGYQAGVDIKLLPRTNISYDQFLQYYKGNTTWSDRNFAFQLSDGSPVDAGLVYNPTVNQPCGNTPPVFDASTTPPTLKDTCNGYQSYGRTAPVRVSYPTEQLSLQSSYFRHVDLSARASYSSADTKADNFAEGFLGLLSRTSQRSFGTSGQGRNKRVVANADFGVTVRITEKFRIIDSFRFSNFRLPGLWDQSQLSFFGGSPASMLSPIVIFDPAVCPANPSACPQHSSQSPADVSSILFTRFLQQDAKYNTVELEYDFSRRFGGRVGYRYGSREINHSILAVANELFFPSNPNRGDCVGLPLNPDGSCSFSGEIDSDSDVAKVAEHSGLLGLWARPTDALRLNFDMELFSADNAPTRITPRNLQRYKVRARFKPKDWISASGSVNILESRNNVTDILHREHDRNYGFTLMLNPNPKFGWEFGYNYDDVFSTTNICYVIGGTTPPGSTLCSEGTPFLSGVSLYNNKVNFGYTNFMFKPVKRVTVNVGYNLTSTSGSTLILGPTPNTLGPLGLNYHKPTAGVDVELARGFTWRTAWGYYGYNEKSDPSPLLARDFHNNSATLSLRYAF